jgi:hypothetical protein
MLFCYVCLRTIAGDIMTAEAVIKKNKALTNFLITLCSVLFLDMTRYEVESKLRLAFKGI